MSAGPAKRAPPSMSPHGCSPSRFCYGASDFAARVSVGACMAELRYGFGKNWAEFIERRLSDKIVQDSMDHMRRLMHADSLKGKTFLDIGCGSGIHSLAALRLGADKVVAFDYDDDSVATSRKVRE